jgi:hypothetical protein
VPNKLNKARNFRNCYKAPTTNSGACQNNDGGFLLRGIGMKKHLFAIAMAFLIFPFDAFGLYECAPPSYSVDSCEKCYYDTKIWRCNDCSGNGVTRVTGKGQCDENGECVCWITSITYNSAGLDNISPVVHKASDNNADCLDWFSFRNAISGACLACVVDGACMDASPMYVPSGCDGIYMSELLTTRRSYLGCMENKGMAVCAKNFYYNTNNIRAALLAGFAYQQDGE